MVARGMDMPDDAGPIHIGNRDLRVRIQWLQIIVAVIAPPAVREARGYIVLYSGHVWDAARS